ncbi:LOW QUALITY PROTEIN: hypothetical protein PHMEG_0001235 [Phytophthora megakarya]|uniref:Reverse transcriptase n=1 Tax=Phytophthora megakarya TaxID=4795 RepID=A0A225X120_9STRA|nr:LOW QUALITY PROTEIN: hypothetical protein PHMEG_0001235 [Phytophthora megakarya]
MTPAEECSMMVKSNEETTAAFNTQSSTVRTRFDAARRTTDIEDPVQQLVNGPEVDIFRSNVADDICFGGETLDKPWHIVNPFRGMPDNFTKSIFVQPKVDFVSHEMANEGIRVDNKKMEAMAKIPLPKKGALTYYTRFIQDFALFGAALHQPKDEEFGEGGD